MNKTLQQKAYSMGIEAFKTGKKRIPAADKNFLNNVIAGCQVGEGLPYLKAWLTGWDEENRGFIYERH